MVSFGVLVAFLQRGARAHDPPKCWWFDDKIMRPFNSLERDRTESRHPLFLIALISALSPRLQCMDFPAAAGGLAGRALQPALVAAIDIARQKIAAGASVRLVGLGPRRH